MFYTLGKLHKSFEFHDFSRIFQFDEKRMYPIRGHGKDFIKANEPNIGDYLVVAVFRVCAGGELSAGFDYGVKQLHCMQFWPNHVAGEPEFCRLDFQPAFLQKFSFKVGNNTVPVLQSSAGWRPEVVSVKAAVIDHKQTTLLHQKATGPYPCPATDFLKNIHQGQENSFFQVNLATLRSKTVV